MKDPTLVILAAGLSSRYGGLKQIDPIGPGGEFLIDYSVYDAVRAGFRRVVFLIAPEMRRDFDEAIGRRVSGSVEAVYAYQSLDRCLPAGFSVPEGRIRPWGTAHALLCCRDVIDGPFAMINADDFYGREAFEKIYQFLKNAQDGAKLDFAMVGYYVKNTVTENGYVSRGVCQVEGGMLQSVTERTHIEKRPEGIAYTEDGGSTWNALAPDTVVSMNLWGFTPGFTPALEENFRRFFQEDVPQNPLKAEYFLPFVVNDLLAQDKAQVTVLSSADKWYGVTYKEDKETVVNAVREMTEAGVYPAPLWQ